MGSRKKMLTYFDPNLNANAAYEIKLKLSLMHTDNLETTLYVLTRETPGPGPVLSPLLGS